MEKLVIITLITTAFLFGCDKTKTTEITEQNISKTQNAETISPEQDPKKSLQHSGFWNKKYYRLEYNPLYGYCYQHLFPTMDTSQEEGVIAFHIKSLEFDPMVIFVVDKVLYKNNQYEITGKINDEKNTIYLKLLDGETLNVILEKYNINESFDMKSGISYASFENEKFKQQDTPVFDIEVYDTCEELDKKIISDISDKLTDEKVKEKNGVDVKTEEGYDCWGKWSNINDMKNVYYELDKSRMKFRDYSDYLVGSGSIRTTDIRQMTYKNGIFYFNFEDNELIGHMCLPIDNNTSMWVLDDINLGIFERIN